MTSIWGFLLQTLSLSLVAALLLIVKLLLKDKLSPRWQYGVWGILALRTILPVQSAGKYILLPIPLWVETLKGFTESFLNSVYSSAYAPIKIGLPIPFLIGKPISVTDWIFAIYAIGVLVMLLRYLFSYIGLRILLRRGSPVSNGLKEEIDEMCAKVGLRTCRAVTVQGLTSAFVCGVFKPVLAIPDGTEPDRKVLLHELLHLRYFDALQSVVWSILRAIHWCNPFMQYVFNYIGNDMEQLCDQRVLERLEGEERREYGVILLSMVNEKYPRAVGTTSLSNGGRNIARRIESIARFKKYPKGMAIVSLCIAAILLSASIFGSNAKDAEFGNVRIRSRLDFERAMASARINRCTTVAGALDTYAKGIMLENGVYIAVASPVDTHAVLAEEMLNSKKGSLNYYHIGRETLNVDRKAYWIYNLEENKEGGYKALLVFKTDYLTSEDGGLMYDEFGRQNSGLIAYPVRVLRDDGWVVAVDGEEIVVPVSSDSSEVNYGSELLPYMKEYTASGKTGKVTVQVRNIYGVDNAVKNNSFFAFMPSEFFDQKIKTSAKFTISSLNVSADYVFGGSDEERKTLASVSIQTVELKTNGSLPEFPSVSLEGDISGSSSNGSQWSSKTVTGDWNGVLSCSGGSMSNDAAGVWKEQSNYPAGYAVRIFWNGQEVEQFVLKEADDGSAETD